MKLMLGLALALAGGVAAAAPLKAPLADVAFLVGDWTADDGKVAEIHGTSKGRSTITVEADGDALLRRDHTEVADARGKSAGGFSQTMLIYAEGGTLKADYVDGEGHVIHYARAQVTPGKAVTFEAAPGAGPLFRLTYALTAPATLAVTFGMTPPGSTAFQTIATGTLRRAAR